MATATLNQGGTLHGVLGGRSVLCFVQPGIIPKGEYLLLPPVEDPIYGTMVPMMPIDPAATASGGLAKGHEKMLAFMKHATGHAKGVAVTPFYDSKPPVPSDKRKQPLWPSTGCFILSAEPMPGRNHAVVQLGFSDLVEALKMGAETIEVT